MRRIISFVATTTAIVLALSGVALATGVQLRDQDRLHDGSCQDQVASGVQLRDQDRLRDGSCDGTAEQVRTRTQARDRTRTQDRLRDGSCS